MSSLDSVEDLHGIRLSEKKTLVMKASIQDLLTKHNIKRAKIETSRTFQVILEKQVKPKNVKNRSIAMRSTANIKF